MKMANKKEVSFSDLGPGYEGIGPFYDLFADNSDIPFYIQYAREVGSPVLDLAAGTGRVTFALARDGHEIVALDNSPSMLNVARERLKTEQLENAQRISIVEGDMTDFELNQKFRLIIIPVSFGHALTTEAQLSTLRCINRHLDDSGIFILDLFPGALQHDHATFVNGPFVLSNNQTIERHGEIHTDFVDQLMRIDLRYIARNWDEEIIHEVEIVSSAAIIFNREVDLLLRITGFEIIDELGTYDGDPYTPESGRRLLILRKGVHDY